MSLHSTKRKTWKRRRLSAIKKLLRFFWMLMDMSLLKFDIYQGGATNCFKSHTNSWCPPFFSRKSFVWCLVRNSPCLTQHRFYRTICLGLLKQTCSIHIFKQTCSWKLRVRLSMCDLLVDIRHWRVNTIWKLIHFGSCRSWCNFILCCWPSKIPSFTKNVHLSLKIKW